MGVNQLIKGVTLEDIYDFMDHGDPGEAPEEIVVFMDLMELVRGLRLRPLFGTRNLVVKHLIVAKGLSRHMAVKVYESSYEYFYSSEEISKQAHRNAYADQIDRQIAIAELAVRDVKDSKAVVEMIKTAFLVRRLDQEEVEFMPEEWRKEPIVLYDTSALSAGMPKINRIELSNQIQSLPGISEKVKNRLEQEALNITLNLFPDVEENVRKTGS